MKWGLLWVAVLTALVSLSEETSSGKYERGTIIAVKQSQTAPAVGPGVTQYEVSVQVRNVIYVTLFTPPHNATGVEYAAGIDVLVLVGDNTLKMPNRLAGTLELPILSKKVLPRQPTIDWSKAPSQYFAMKMQNLSEVLNLTDEQQAKVKPIAEQETGEVNQTIFNPVVSREERLSRWQKIVSKGDSKMRSFLSQAQWEQLQQLRKQQKQELKQLVKQADANDKR
jgi:hypothetical protein